jgi:hypothetical protein
VGQYLSPPVRSVGFYNLGVATLLENFEGPQCADPSAARDFPDGTVAAALVHNCHARRTRFKGCSSGRRISTAVSNVGYVRGRRRPLCGREVRQSALQIDMQFVMIDKDPSPTTGSSARSSTTTPQVEPQDRMVRSA